MEMAVFADVNHADKADGRRSVSRVAVTLAKSMMSWCSSTHGVISVDRSGRVSSNRRWS